MCTGFEWYLFPNHFFLPRNAKLQFIADKFGGVLPQHFASIGGTYSEPLQPFNDLNREETSRYVDLSLCDYLVLSLDENKNYGDDDTMRRYLSRIAHCSSGANIDSCDANEEYNGSSFSVVHNTNVLSAEFSSPLARAYWIPAKSIQSKKYYLFRNNN